MPTLVLVADRERTVLDPAIVARVRDAAGGGAPVVLSPGEAVMLPCPAAPMQDVLDGAPIDAMWLPGAPRRARLLVADMDSTIVTGETLDELAAFAGVGELVAAITARSMNGEIDFAAALRERVALLRGLRLEALDRTFRGVRLTLGARGLVGTMRAHGAQTALVSGGFTFFTARVAALAGFAVHRANVLEDDGAVLTGRVAEPILDPAAKLRTLHELAAAGGIAAEDTLAVGDGANDLPMIRAAGLGVAYHAKPVVRAEAAVQVRHAGLRAVLFLQGYREDEIWRG